MTDLRELFARLETETSAHRPEELFERARHQAVRLRRRRHVGISIVALSLLVVIGVVAAAATRDTSGTSGRVSAAQPSQPSLTLADLSSAIKQPTAIAVANGHVWVTGYSPRPGSTALLDFDAATGSLLGQVALPDDGGPYAIAVIDSTMWIRSQRGERSTHLLKIDLVAHRIVTTVTLKLSAGLAATPTAVWAVDFGELLRIDPTSAAVAAAIPLPASGLYSPVFVTAGPIGVWLTNPYDNTVLRVDDTTNTALPFTTLTGRAGPIVQTTDTLWVNTGSQLVGLDPRDPASRRAIDLPSRILAVDVDGANLWVVTDTGVYRVDTASQSVTPASAPRPGTSPSFIAVDAQTGAVWIATNRPPAVQQLSDGCISAGPPTVAVPDVVGMRLPAAIQRLEASGLQVVGAGTPDGDPTGAAAVVSAQEPGAGQLVNPHACVGLRTRA